MTVPESFDRDDIVELLDALGSKLAHRGVSAAIYLVGGAAVALRGVSENRRTADIDAVMVPQGVVMEAAAELARERGLRPGWLSAGAASWVPRPIDLAPPEEPGLAVRMASDEVLLAMKIRAARGTRDMRDIIPLARGLGVSAADALFNLVVRIYGEDELEANEYGGLAEIMLRCAAVERQLERGETG